jgi:predicted nucleic acid-binding Zn ribbon protein
VPRYDYHCDANGRTVEVAHGMTEKLATWGEVCERSGQPMGSTPPETPVERVIHAPALAFPRGNVELKGQGFTKLVRRDDGVYENVTAREGQSRVVHRDDPASVAGLNLAETAGD